MFRLVKWYLDLVTDDGTVLIVYAAELRWPAVRLEYVSTFLAHRNAAPRERSAWTGVVLPEVDGEGITLGHVGLGFRGQWHRGAPPVEAALLADAEGAVQWDCLMPKATARAVVDGRTLIGSGYAERLTLTRPPWTLPWRGLRWGRFTGASRTATWIDFQGDAPQCRVWLDSVPWPGVTVDATGVRRQGAGEGPALHLAPDRELLNRQALQVISKRMPALRALPLGRIGTLREVKELAWGRLHVGAAVADEGWVIHEEVCW